MLWPCPIVAQARRVLDGQEGTPADPCGGALGRLVHHPSPPHPRIAQEAREPHLASPVAPERANPHADPTCLEQTVQKEGPPLWMARPSPDCTARVSGRPT